MGLFSKDKQKCDICGEKIGLGSMKFLNGRMCSSCFVKLRKYNKELPSSLALDEIKEYVDFANENIEKYNNFKESKKVGKYFAIDQKNRQWLIPAKPLSKEIPRVYSFDDIVDFELIKENNEATRPQDKKVHKLFIKITVNDINTPLIMIKLINVPVREFSSNYKVAFKLSEEILSLLNIITSKNKNDDLNTKEFIFCSKCGDKLEIDSIFCSKCGQKLYNN